jgi:hypothetical protein
MPSHATAMRSRAWKRKRRVSATQGQNGHFIGSMSACTLFSYLLVVCSVHWAAPTSASAKVPRKQTHPGRDVPSWPAWSSWRSAVFFHGSVIQGIESSRAKTIILGGSAMEPAALTSLRRRRAWTSQEDIGRPGRGGEGDRRSAGFQRLGSRQAPVDACVERLPVGCASLRALLTRPLTRQQRVSPPLPLAADAWILEDPGGWPVGLRV